MKNIRKKLITQNGGQIYIVKTNIKNWCNITSIHTSKVNNDVYIVSNHNALSHLHNNKCQQLNLLHELGHLREKFKSHLISELFATFYGFFKYRKLLFPHLKIRDLLIIFDMPHFKYYFLHIPNINPNNFVVKHEKND